MFIVNCLMFRLAERNEELSTVEAPTSPFVKGKWHMKIPIYFDYAFSGFISICMFSTTSNAMQTLE